MAQAGRHVILIDCDVRNPSLSRVLAPDAKVGFLDVVVGEADLGRAVRHDAATGLSFLPMVPKKNLRNPTELLASREARLLIDSLKSSYDHIIIDMAPLISTVDVLAVSRLVQSYVLVIEWGTTKMEAVRHALGNTPAVQMKMLGAVLNKVDFAGLGRYEPHGSYHHYYYGHADSPPSH
jgi:succinoglycan biosynthesis transport protein ExoP